MTINIELLLKSYFIGFILATPVGAASIVCMRRLLTRGYIAGIVSALGIATADVFYASIAAFCISIVQEPIVKYQWLIRLGGGVILLLLGTKVYLKKRPVMSCSIVGINYFKVFSSTFLLTLSNPLIIIFLAAILTSIGIQQAPSSVFETISFMGCVFSGSISWWIFIIGALFLLKYRPTPSIIQIINKISAALLFVSGIYFVIKSITLIKPFLNMIK